MTITYADFEDHLLDDGHHYFLGQVPESLRLDSVGFDGLRAIHPDRYHVIQVRDLSGRQRFNVLGAIDAVTPERTTVCNETTINVQVIRELLGKLSARQVGLPITLVLDNTRYHMYAVVQALAVSPKIELLSLPPYLPNPKLIERLWKFVNEECLSYRYHEDFTRFKTAIMDCLEGIQGSMRWQFSRTSRSIYRLSRTFGSQPREVLYPHPAASGSLFRSGLTKLRSGR